MPTLRGTRARSQHAWSMAELQGLPAENQNMPCGTFYANLCGMQSDALSGLVDLPPTAPPPPMPPDADLVTLTPAAVHASGGFDADTGTDPKAACGDFDGRTPCTPADREHPVTPPTRMQTHARSLAKRAC